MSLDTALLQLQKVLEIPEYHPPLLPAVNEVSSEDIFLSTARIEHLVAEESSALRQIDEIARRIQDIELAASSVVTLVISELASRQVDLEARVNVARFLRAPIRKVPDDVLANIFVETAALTTQEVLLNGTIEWDPSTICRVCRLWNEVSRSTPAMWSDIFLFTDTPEPFHRFTTGRLLLAKNTSLSVHSIKFRNSLHHHRFSSYINTGLSLFDVYKQRIVTLKLNIGAFTFGTGSLNLSFPELRRLELVIDCNDCRGCNDCRVFVEGSTLDVPQLRDLSVGPHYRFDHQDEMPSAGEFALAIMHIPQFDVYCPFNLKDHVDGCIKTTVVEAIRLRLGVVAPAPRTTLHPETPPPQIKHAAVRLDCLSMRIHSYSDDILPIIEEQMQTLAYCRLSEPCEGRIFWLHPEVLVSFAFVATAYASCQLVSRNTVDVGGPTRTRRPGILER